MAPVEMFALSFWSGLALVSGLHAERRKVLDRCFNCTVCSCCSHWKVALISTSSAYLAVTRSLVAVVPGEAKGTHRCGVLLVAVWVLHLVHTQPFFFGALHQLECRCRGQCTGTAPM